MKKNLKKLITFTSFACPLFLLATAPAQAFDFSFESKTNNDYSYTIELDSNDSLSAGENRLILTNLSGVTNVTANSPYSISSEDFDSNSANFDVDTALSGQSTLTGVITITSADSLDDLEYQAFYIDDGTPRVASNNVVQVPFAPSTNTSILLLLCGFGWHRLKRKFN